jgi:hypothetical protein
MLSFYLAGAFTRRPELIELERTLQDFGFRSTARWLQLEHSLSNEHDAERLGPEFSAHDRDDVHEGDVFVMKTNPFGDPYTSGGRHVEFGIALDRKPILIYDPYRADRPPGGKSRENIFHWYSRNVLFTDVRVPAVQIVETEDELIAKMMQFENMLRSVNSWPPVEYTIPENLLAFSSSQRAEPVPV